MVKQTNKQFISSQLRVALRQTLKGRNVPKTLFSQKIVVKLASPGQVYQFSKLPYSSRPRPPFEQTNKQLAQFKSSAREGQTMTAKMGWLRHVLTILSVIIFVSHFINFVIVNLLMKLIRLEFL